MFHYSRVEVCQISERICTQVYIILGTLLKFNICGRKKTRLFNFPNKEVNVISRVQNIPNFGQNYKIHSIL